MTTDYQHPPVVRVDPDVMGGAACFAGSRLPVDTVLASLEAGVSWTRLVASWPWLTEDHVRAARDWSRDRAANPGPRHGVAVTRA